MLMSWYYHCQNERLDSVFISIFSQMAYLCGFLVVTFSHIRLGKILLEVIEASSGLDLQQCCPSPQNYCPLFLQAFKCFSGVHTPWNSLMALIPTTLRYKFGLLCCFNRWILLLFVGACKGGYPCPPSEFQSLICRYFRRFPCRCRNFNMTLLRLCWPSSEGNFTRLQS